MQDHWLIIKFVLATIIGMAVKLKQKNDSLKDLAVKSNLQFPSPMQFILDNKKAIVWTSLTMALWQLVMGTTVQSIITNSPVTPESFFWGWIIIARQNIITGALLLLYTTIAYMGQDFLFSALSRTSKEVREAVDYKTTIADTSTGTTNEPTPIK